MRQAFWTFVQTSRHFMAAVVETRRLMSWSGFDDQWCGKAMDALFLSEANVTFGSVLSKDDLGDLHDLQDQMMVAGLIGVFTQKVLPSYSDGFGL
jgi:hypothetical protein